MLIGELINNLAQKAGVDADSPELKSLLASPELASVSVPDELSTTIDRGLLNIEAAKNNHPDIKRKYQADIYDGMDKQLMALIASDTFDESDIAEIKAEAKTTKKLEMIVAKLKAAKSTAKGADKEEINRQLTAAHEAARLAKEEVTNVRSEYEGKIKDIHRGAAIKAVFNNYKTIYDELPGEIRVATMEAIINKSLQDKNAELRTDENGNLQLVGKDGNNVFGSDHRQLSPQSFLDQSFAPILKVSGQRPVVTPQTRQTQVATPATQENAQLGSMKNHNAQVLADMATPKASMV